MNFYELRNGKKASIFIFAFILLSIFYLNIISFPSLEREHSKNFGLFFEIVVLLLVSSVFLLINFSPINNKSYVTIALGLTFWSGSCVLDVADEIILQPLWLAMWGEDALRTIGMLFATFGSFFIVKSVSKNFSDIKQLSIMDELTNMPNRRFFKNRLTENEDKSMYIILFDVDNFKDINDSYGHSEGDRALSLIGKAIHKLPISAYNGFSARIGGDEFGICVCTNERHEVENLIQNLINTVRNESIEGNKISISVGVSYKKNTETTSQAMKCADEAMYLSKKKGRNRYEFHRKCKL